MESHVRLLPDGLKIHLGWHWNDFIHGIDYHLRIPIANDIQHGFPSGLEIFVTFLTGN